LVDTVIHLRPSYIHPYEYTYTHTHLGLAEVPVNGGLEGHEADPAANLLDELEALLPELLVARLEDQLELHANLLYT
jgi:hypothetical protein